MTSRPIALAAAVVLLIVIGAALAFVGALLLVVAAGGWPSCRPQRARRVTLWASGAGRRGLTLVAAGLWLAGHGAWAGSLVSPWHRGGAAMRRARPGQAPCYGRGLTMRGDGPPGGPSTARPPHR